MSNEVAVHDLDKEKIELIKQTVAKGATDLELELFLHACKRTGLDPLMKQLYAIKRWSQADQREVMAFQTGIDGLRLIADRTKLYAGSDDALFTGVAKEEDFKATVTVWKLVNGEARAFTASARWPEYVQKKKDGTPTKFWLQMPFGQLGKCAESLALRKAFPMELSNLYSDEEMVHLDSEWKTAEKPSEILARVEAAEQPPAPATTTQDSAMTGQSMSSIRAAETGQGDRSGDALKAASMEPQQATHEQTTDAPALSTDDPAEPYRARLCTCERSNRAVNVTYRAIPDEIRQDCYQEYTAQLKAVGKATT